MSDVWVVTVGDQALAMVLVEDEDRYHLGLSVGVLEDLTRWASDLDNLTLSRPHRGPFFPHLSP